MEAGYRTHLKGVVTPHSGNSDRPVLLETQDLTQIFLLARIGPHLKCVDLIKQHSELRLYLPSSAFLGPKVSHCHSVIEGPIFSQSVSISFFSLFQIHINLVSCFYPFNSFKKINEILKVQN